MRLGNFWCYLDEQVTLSYKLFREILPLVKIREEKILDEWVEKILSGNWGRVRGGIKTQQKLRIDPNFRNKWRQIRKKAGRKIRVKFLKNWDIGFRKAGKRNTIGPKGEKMFNEHEKRIAEFLLAKNKNYEYERLIKLNGNFYFPDFIIGNTIIERCGFFTKTYLKVLKKKIEDYSKYWKGKVIIIYPDKFSDIIKSLIAENPKFILIKEDNLDDMAMVV